MCPSSQRPDALNALTLVENIARLTTQGFFGFVFAALAGIGKTYLTFFINAVRPNSKLHWDFAGTDVYQRLSRWLAWEFFCYLTSPRWVAPC
jgi:hypothetical protein